MTTLSQSVKTALISVSDKTRIVEFATALHERSFILLSTGGSARILRDANLPVKEVYDHTGFPEIMDGRVKTLHPVIHGGILGRRGQDDAVMLANGLTPIDLVVVNLYPFESAISDPDCTMSLAIENIDIGGPAMLRAAAKNHAHVAVIVDPADYDRVVSALDTNQRTVDEKTRFDLAVKAFEYTARYDGAIANYLGKSAEQDERHGHFSRTLNRQWYLKQIMRYGENPHQKAALYIDSKPLPGSISTARQFQGKALSFNNIVDSEAAIQCVKQFDQSPACVIVKHANPCGTATDAKLLEAYRKAFMTDPESAFGGIIAFNRELDDETAAEIVDRQFAEVILAPFISKPALDVLQSKENIRVLGCGKWPEGDDVMEIKQVTGGLLVQQSDRELFQSMQVVTKKTPNHREMNDLLFAWKVAKMVKSNAIVYARDGMTIGVGAGQMSRINSARIATIKAKQAGLDVSGAVMASDAFFPFGDILNNAAADGITAVIQPGGSIRDQQVISTADEHGMAMVFTGMRHFKH